MMKLSHAIPQGATRRVIPFCPTFTLSCRHFLVSPVRRSAQKDRQIRVRFAPSPTGQLHLGGLRTALYNFLFARSHNGTFILRVEDTDQARLVPGAVESLIQMLEWTGIIIDEGPTRGGSFGPYIQSERLCLYTEQLKTLLENGAAYPCFCTARRLDLLRRETLARGEVPRYDNRCRHVSQSDAQAKIKSGVPHTVRFRLESYTEPWQDLVFGPITCDISTIESDPILMKSDGFPTYHFANVVDDHFMDITHVLRGAEWQISTTKHLLLYKAFGWDPPAFGHFPLLVNKDGRKFSKRQNDVHVEHYKNLGYFPEAVLNLVTNVGAGFTVRETAGMDMKQLIAHFELSRLNTHSAPVHFDRLDDFNQLHLIRQIDDETKLPQLVSQVRRMIQQHVEQPDDLPDERIRNVLTMSKNRLSVLSDVCREEFEFAWQRPVLQFSDCEDACDILQQVNTAVSAIDTCRYNRVTLSAAVGSVIQTGGYSYGRFMKVLRRALCGPKSGPAVLDVMLMLGKEATIDRIQQALAALSVDNVDQTSVS